MTSSQQLLLSRQPRPTPPFISRHQTTNASQPEAIINVPNVLSFSRILTAPFIAGCIVHNDTKLALALFAYAAASDVVDGLWARRFNQQTIVGSFLDPMSDKIMTICVASALGHISLLSPWVVAMLVAKDLALMIGTTIVRIRAVKTLRLSALFNVRDVPVSTVAPSIAGKFAASTVAALLGTALIQFAYPAFLPSLGCSVPLAPEVSGCIRNLEYVAVSSTLFASFQYLYYWRETFPKIKRS
jgi:cardiolipin synthase